MKLKSQRQCILLIDDAPTQLLALENMLSLDYDVKTAGTGEEGIELIKKGVGVDLILLDLYMPNMTGFEVITHLKSSEETKHIPIILITGSVSTEDEVHGLALGAVDYIRKPFTEVVVKLRVEIHLKLIAQMKIIENLSLTDGLAGINNRRSFDQVVKSVWGFARRANDCFGMMMLDIDRFKSFNDRYGHLNGDVCLKAVVGCIGSTLKRESDSLYRWGGEEFVVLMPGISIDGVMTVAETVRERVSLTPIHMDEATAFVIISIGVGVITPEVDFNHGFLTFLGDVNKALHRAKENGRNRVEKA